MYDCSSITTYYITVDPEPFASLNVNVSAELWIPAVLRLDRDEYQIKLAFRGAHTRKFPKKSFQIQFTYPELYEGQREIHLNAEYADPSLIRNKLSFEFFAGIGVLSPQTHYVLLYINEAFAGIYLKLEAVDELFLQRRELPVGPIYYAVNSDANFSLLQSRTDEVKDALEAGYVRKYGTDDDDQRLRAFIYTINITPVAQFEEAIEKLLDVDSYLRWLAGAVCTQNLDGFIHNYALYQNSQTGCFAIIPWDYDATWGRNVNGRILHPNRLAIDGRNTLSARILDIPKFRQYYCEILENILQTQFTEHKLEPMITALHECLEPFIGLDPYKKALAEEFASEPAFILSFIGKRNAFLQEQLESFKKIN
ncbi:CotH kinase family protein [Paenibacillus piri]|uniref:Spore coat protein n=1 Tax=Paenibacillus piri TaxID=2547395 RepID=A0A4R5KBF4_9BACL|nr:CotH kinase family protein [Paenibacillus piri]TDF92553.1 spore coat protein [Paenibacillus piri]